MRKTKSSYNENERKYESRVPSGATNFSRINEISILTSDDGRLLQNCSHLIELNRGDHCVLFAIKIHDMTIKIKNSLAKVCKYYYEWNKWQLKIFEKRKKYFDEER